MERRLPRISLVTPSFNQAAFLERTIKSVIDQGYPNLEYFVMDGGSTDSSVEIIKRYADHLTHWQSGPDEGQTAAVNAGWRMATGDILGWLNSDDFLLAGALDHVGAFFAEHPDISVVYGSMQNIDSRGQVLNYVGRPYSNWRMILSHDCVPQPSAFIQRTALDKAGYLDESLHYVMDLDLFMRMARQQEPVFLPRPLAAATVHPDAKTIKGQRPMTLERSRVRLRYASWWQAPLVRLQPMASAIFQSQPQFVKSWLNRIRPRRTFQAPLDPSRVDSGLDSASGPSRE